MVKTFCDLTEGMTPEQLKQVTPEWNIEHYTKLLKYTKHTVSRKKLQKELKWWVEQKEWQDRIKSYMSIIQSKWGEAKGDQ